MHFKKETPERRKLIMSRLCEAGVDVRIYRRSCTHGDEAARQDCLVALTLDLVEMRAMRLVLDTREERDIHDMRTIRRALGNNAKALGMTYEHVCSGAERLLRIADAAAWCFGAGGDWRRRAEGVVSEVVDLDNWAWTARNPAADRPDVDWVHFLGLRGLGRANYTSPLPPIKLRHPKVW
ncbi:MAG: hypothetical protein ABWY11_12390 [Umezawaea sp.]